MPRKKIRDLDSGLFLGRNGQWQKDAMSAQTFSDEESAMLAVERYGIMNADLVTVNDFGQVTTGQPLRISN